MQLGDRGACVRTRPIVIIKRVEAYRVYCISTRAFSCDLRFMTCVYSAHAGYRRARQRAFYHNDYTIDLLQLRTTNKTRMSACSEPLTYGRSDVRITGTGTVTEMIWFRFY